MNLTPLKSGPFDVLVAGAGLAGIRAAVSCALENKRVLMVTPSVLCSGSSFYPLMDTIHCLCTAGPEDKELFFQDIKSCSWGMNDDWLCRYYIDHIEESIERMPEMGIIPRKLPEKKLACFGRTERDLYCWKDWKALRKSVAEAIERTGRIAVMEHTSLVHIAVSENTVAGAVLLSPGGLETLPLKSVILAGGGLGGLYLHNLNTADTAGSVHALALKAGAKLINLEFNQFIPGFLSPLYKTVFREGSLRYCTGLTGPDGQDALRELLPRRKDWEECLALREPHGPFTTADSSKYFDIALMKAALKGVEAGSSHSGGQEGCVIRYSPQILEDRRSYVQDYVSWLSREHHIRIEQDPISIAPFFHAANGGILVDQGCRTHVRGLYACGEAAGGIHGADRLGGMASGSCLVFGSLAAQSACRDMEAPGPGLPDEGYIREQMMRAYAPCSPFTKASPEPQAALSEGASPETASPFSLPEPKAALSEGVSPETPSPEAVCQQVKGVMWKYGSIIRTAGGLTRALREIDALGESLGQNFSLEGCPGVPELSAHIKACQFVDVSRAMLISMLARRESRGGHYREDFPQPSPSYDCHRTVIGLAQGQYRVM